MKNNQTEELGTLSVGKLILKLSLPAIIAQFVNLLYSIVDRMFIGHIPDIGDLALTGVGVSFPLILLISAFANLVSMGGAPRASMYLGRGDKDSAEKILGNSFSLLIIISIVLTILFRVFGDQLLLAFGASSNTIVYASEYLNIYALGTLFVQLTLGLNAFISAQGFAFISMCTILIGAIINIILDPIFIFYLDMGVKGAALATVISQFVSMLWNLNFLFGKKTSLKLKLKNMKLSKQVIIPIISLGLSPFIMQSTESLVTIAFNSSLYKYGGDLAVGSMTILASIQQMTMVPIRGWMQGAQPIISFNYGAKNADRVKTAYSYSIRFCLGFSILVWAIILLFPKMFITIFNDNPQLIDFTVTSIRILLFSSFIMGNQMVCQQTFIALGNAKTSIFIAVLRKIVLLIPLMYLLPMFVDDNLKVWAVFASQPIADFIIFVLTIILFSKYFKTALAEISDEKEKENMNLELDTQK